MKYCNANDIFFVHFFDFLPRLHEVLCTCVKSQRLSLEFTPPQREFLGLLTFGFQLVRTNVAEKVVKIPYLNITC